MSWVVQSIRERPGISGEGMNMRGILAFNPRSTQALHYELDCSQLRSFVPQATVCRLPHCDVGEMLLFTYIATH